VKKQRTVAQMTRRLSGRATAQDSVVQATVVERSVTAAVSAAPASTNATGNGQSRHAWKGKGGNGKNGASRRTPVAPAAAAAVPAHPGRDGAAGAGGAKSHKDGRRQPKGGNLPEPDPVQLQAPAESPQAQQVGAQ